MNQKMMMYVILISIIFVSLGIGMFILNIKEGLTDSSSGLQVGDVFTEITTKNVTDKNENPIMIAEVNDKGIVTETKPNIKIDNGNAIIDSNGYVILSSDNETKSGNVGTLKLTKGLSKGSVLTQEITNIVYDTTGNLIKVSAVNSEGIVTETNPRIKLDTNGKPIKDSKGKVIMISKDSNIFSKKYGNIEYNSNNIDVTYHDSEQQIIAESGYKDLEDGTIYVIDKDGNKVAIPKSNVQNQITYYQPDSFRFGASTYVPSYEDSVFLSRTSGQSKIGSFANPKNMYGGMCSYLKDQPQQLEEGCQKLDASTCASTSCCVLLGGQKCVSGNSQGPSIKSNYSDVYVPNRDFYYYQGICYGNCP
jgi:hypothetical protein